MMYNSNKAVIILINTNKSIICIGACNIDYKFKAKDVMVKNTSNPVDSLMSYGGVVRNVGENLSRFNQNVSLMTMVGDDILGEKLISDIKAYMNVSLIDKRFNQSTGQYYAIMNMEGNMDIAYANMSIYNDMNHEWIKSHTNEIKKYDLIVSDLNVQESGIASLLELTNKHKLPLAIIGVSGPKMKNLPEDIKDLYLIIVNKDESQTYFNTLENDSKVLCQYWLNKGVKKVVITSGKEDVFFGDEFGILSLSVIKILKQKIKDATGAGDAFSGGVLLGLLEEKSLSESVIYGMINANLTIQSEDSVRKNINYKTFIQEVKEYESL
jgi:pseudouridine kinase